MWRLSTAHLRQASSCQVKRQVKFLLLLSSHKHKIAPTTSSKTSVSFVSSSLTTGFSLLSLSDKSAVDVVRLGGRRWYLKSYTPSLCCTTNTIRQSQPKGFIATFQTPPFSAAIETTPGYRSNYPIILSVEAFSVPRSWSIRSHSSRLSRLHPEIFVSAFVEYTRLIIPHNKQSRTPPARS